MMKGARIKLENYYIVEDEGVLNGRVIVASRILTMRKKAKAEQVD
jgi:hypothetical protein